MGKPAQHHDHAHPLTVLGDEICPEVQKITKLRQTYSLT